MALGFVWAFRDVEIFAIGFYQNYIGNKKVNNFNLRFERSRYDGILLDQKFRYVFPDYSLQLLPKLFKSVPIPASRYSLQTIHMQHFFGVNSTAEGVVHQLKYPMTSSTRCRRGCVQEVVNNTYRLVPSAL